MLGLSRTVAGGRTGAVEFLRIEGRAGSTVYGASHRAVRPDEFRLTQQSENRVVFENPQHDHPKIIRYSREPDGSLRSEIEGDEKGQHRKMEFRFQPISRR